MNMKRLIATVVGLSMSVFPVSANEVFFEPERQSIEEYFHQSTKGFLDTAGHWAEEQIYEAVDLKYVSGTSQTTFSPDIPMTRAMLVTMLYRMAGEPEVSGKSSFTDVPAGCWYENAVIWSVDKSISYTQEQTVFDAEGSATREQIVTMLYRYARTMGYDVSQFSDTSRFSDSTDISPSSLPAVSWAVANGLVSGKEHNRFEPKASATRAEVVAIIMRFLHLNDEGEA